jgi:hypothetical protein
MTIVCFALGANCQSKIDWREEYRQAVSVIARLKKDSSSLEQLKMDTFMLKRTIQLKDNAFRMLKEQLDFNRQVVDTLTEIKRQQAAIIANQGNLIGIQVNTIEKLGKQKGSVLKRILHVVAAGLVGYAIGNF